MKLNFNKQQCFAVPTKLYTLLNHELAQVGQPELNAYALTFNFRDPSYSAEHGGYHPVEMRLEKHNDQWEFIYITDFSYQGSPYPELVKDIDVCFESKRAYSLYSGWSAERDAKELIKLFLTNFIAYHDTDVYNARIGFEHN